MRTDLTSLQMGGIFSIPVQISYKMPIAAHMETATEIFTG